MKTTNQIDTVHIYLSSFVSEHGILCRLLPLIPDLKFRQVPIVIPLHLQVKHLGLGGNRRGDQVIGEDFQNSGADLRQLRLDLRSVVLDEHHVLVVLPPLLLLLDGGDDAPRGSERADDVFVGDGEEVALFDGEL